MTFLSPLRAGLSYGTHIRHRFDYYPNQNATVVRDGRPWILYVPVENAFDTGGRLSVREDGTGPQGTARRFNDMINDYIQRNTPPIEQFVCDIPWNLNDPSNSGFEAEKQYSRSQVDYWPTNVHGAARCFQYIRDQAQNFGAISGGYALNPDKGAIAGFSSGGVCALLASYRELNFGSGRGARSIHTRWPYGSSNRPAWVLDYAGLTDFHLDFFSGTNSVQGILGIGSTTEVTSELLDEISARLWVNQDTPPTYIMQENTATGTSPPYTNPHHADIGLDLQVILNSFGVQNAFSVQAPTVGIDLANRDAIYNFMKSVTGL